MMIIIIIIPIRFKWTVGIEPRTWVPSRCSHYYEHLLFPLSGEYCFCGGGVGRDFPRDFFIPFYTAGKVQSALPSWNANRGPELKFSFASHFNISIKLLTWMCFLKKKIKRNPKCSWTAVQSCLTDVPNAADSRTLGTGKVLRQPRWLNEECYS